MESLYNEIDIKIDEIIESIEDSYNYKKYIDLKNQMLKNDYINNLIREIKIIQQSMVKKVYNKKDISLDDIEINKRLKILESIPLYVEYNKYHDLVNNDFILINDKINDYIENINK